MRTAAPCSITARRRSSVPSTRPAANSTASSVNPSAEPSSYPQIPRTRQSFEGCCSRPRKEGIEVLIETFIRKQLGLKAHTVTRVEETEDYMIIHIDRLGSRLLRCGLCRQRCRKVHSVRQSREWRDLDRDESGGNRGLHDHPHRPAGESAAALRALPAAMPEGAQRASVAGMARSIDAEIAVEAALPPTSSRMSEVRRAGGGLSLGGAVGAGHHGSVQCRGETGTGVELARDVTPVRPELEKRGHDCEAGGAVRVEKPVATARARDRDR